MELINLNESSRHKLTPAILKAGGRYGLTEKWKTKGVGVSGLMYIRGHKRIHYENVHDKPVHVTLEKLKAGLAIYFRNTDINLVLVVEANEVDHIHIAKGIDTISQPKNFFYKLGRLFTSDYLIWRNLLIENEKIEFAPISVTIDFHLHETVEFEISAFKPRKVIGFLQSISSFQIKHNVEGFVIIP